MNKCDECIHNNVCKLADIAKRINGKLTILFDEVEKEFEDPVLGQFEVEVKCKDFKLEVPKTIGISYLSPKLEISNPCEDCDWYKNHILDGKYYAGDAPCNWCSKRQAYCSTLNGGENK